MSDPITGGGPAINISVIVPVYNGGQNLRSCLSHICSSDYHSFEILVVDDGSADGSRELAREFGCIVLSTGGRRGPAAARNVGARKAKGAILFFLDADVCVSADAMQRVSSAFEKDPELGGIIGSYDDSPGSLDFLSQYRNLMHCYVHRHSNHRAFTFWSGCGAIRRDKFLQVGGFDVSYARPSVEDIDLGYRLSRSGVKVVLDAGIVAKHLKHWTLMCMIRTDILDRGIPWTELIVRNRIMPSDLNLKTTQRISVGLMAMLSIAAAIGCVYAGSRFLLLLCTLAFLSFAHLAVSEDFRRRPDRVVAVGLLAALIAALALSIRMFWLIPVMIGAYPLLLLRRWCAERKLAGSRLVKYLCGAYVGVTAFVVLFFLRQPVLYVFYGILAILVIINLDFYRFLAGRMGRLNTLAAVPFHLLFYLYSGFSFVVGVLKYLAAAAFGWGARKPAPLENAAEGNEFTSQ